MPPNFIPRAAPKPAPAPIAPTTPYDLYLVSYEEGGHARPVPVGEAEEAARDPSRANWLHIVVRDFDAATRLLVEGLGFHPVAAEDALTDEERPELKEFDDNIFFVLPAVTGFADGEFTFVEVSFFLREHSLVTVSTEPVPVLVRWHERLMTKAHTRDPRPAFLMHAVADALIDDYFPYLDAFEERTDALSDQIYGEREGDVKKILALKQSHLLLRRRLAPARDVLNALQRRDIDLIPDDARPYIQDLYTNANRIIEAVDSNRESLANLLDVCLSVNSNRLNIVVQRMTAISTVLMIATLVSSVYGMNFRRMPELEWYYGYPLALALMVALSLLALLVFKLKRWI